MKMKPSTCLSYGRKPRRTVSSLLAMLTVSVIALADGTAPDAPGGGGNTPSERASKLVVHFFGSSTCGECHSIREEILKPLSRKHPQTLDVRVHDIDDEEGYVLLDALEHAMPRTGFHSPPERRFYQDLAKIRR